MLGFHGQGKELAVDRDTANPVGPGLVPSRSREAGRVGVVLREVTCCLLAKLFLGLGAATS